MLSTLLPSSKEEELCRDLGMHTQDFNDIEHVKKMLKPIMKLTTSKTKKDFTRKDEDLPTIYAHDSKYVGRMNDDDGDNTLDVVQFDNFVDEEEDEEKENSVDFVSSFSLEGNDEQ